MKRTLFSALVLALGLAPLARADESAVAGLFDAKADAAGVFDGSLAGAASVSVPAAGSGRAPSGISKASPAPAAPASADVAPVPARGISDGKIGLYPETDFVVGTGRCSACRAPDYAKLYFPDDVIATPKSGAPALIWIGAHELVEGATLSEDGTKVKFKDGTEAAFALVPQLKSNFSYYDASSLDFFRKRTLRMRGEFASANGVRTFVARSIWPEDFRVDSAGLETARASVAEDVDDLVAADGGGAAEPFSAKVLWERAGADRNWADKPAMGFMLNGAQADDDETLGGHFSFFTGMFPAGGSMADWMFDNFYDMNLTSEKGITASMVPMDKYVADLNSGQAWYRPSAMLVLIMKDARAPLELQEKFKDQYARYYAQKVKYDKTHLTCTGLIVDPLKEKGWSVTPDGPTPALIALAAKQLASAKDPKAGDQIYATLREEPTRVFPRAAFDAVGGDLLGMVGADGAEPVSRELSPLEKTIQQDLVAILFVRIPQIPSSRALGRDPVSGVMDYFLRAPMDHSKWKVNPVDPRPFPPK